MKLYAILFEQENQDYQNVLTLLDDPSVVEKLKQLETKVTQLSEADLKGKITSNIPWGMIHQILSDVADEGDMDNTLQKLVAKYGIATIAAAISKIRTDIRTKPKINEPQN